MKPRSIPVSNTVLSTRLSYQLTYLIHWEGSKLTHFKKLYEKTDIPYSEMVHHASMLLLARTSLTLLFHVQLFFDDEHRNKEVERLGGRAFIRSHDHGCRY